MPIREISLRAVVRKAEDGSISAEQLSWFNNLTSAERDAYRAIWSEKFELFASHKVRIDGSFDLGTSISDLEKQFREHHFRKWDVNIRDENFQPSYYLRGWDEFEVLSFRPRHSVELVDCIALVKNHGGLMTGVQGLVAAWMKIGNSLGSEGDCIISPDEEHTFIKPTEFFHMGMLHKVGVEAGRCIWHCDRPAWDFLTVPTSTTFHEDCVVLCFIKKYHVS